MPESRKRKKAVTTGGERVPVAPRPSPRWWAPTMVVLMVLGLVCVVATYLTQGNLPVPGWGNWNLAIGFGVMVTGFLMTMRWR